MLVETESKIIIGRECKSRRDKETSHSVLRHRLRKNDAWNAFWKKKNLSNRLKKGVGGGEQQKIKWAGGTCAKAQRHKVRD